MKSIIIFLFLNSISVHLIASDCSTIELDKNNGSISNIDVYQQGYTNSCYSHAGSVMLDSWLHSHGGDKNKKTNPFAMAIFNKASVQAAGLGNISCEAIENTYKHGRCLNDEFNINLQAILPQDPSPDSLTPSSNVNDLIMALSGFKNQLDELRPKRQHKKQNSFLYQREMRAFRDKARLEAEAFHCQLMANSNEITTFSNDIHKILKATLKNSDKSFIKEYTKVICGDSLEEVKKPRPKCRQMMRYRFAENKTPKKFEDTINKLLESPNPQPIGVGYCSVLLDSGRGHRGMEEGILGFTSLESINDSFNCGLHESVVIGRKKIGNKCYFKIRNSWGESPDYSDDWPSDNEGNVWVETEDLTQNMGSLTYLEE